METKILHELKKLAQVPSIREQLDKSKSEIDRIYAIQVRLIAYFICECWSKRYSSEVAYILAMSVILCDYIEYDVITEIYADFMMSETDSVYYLGNELMINDMPWYKAFELFINRRYKFDNCIESDQVYYCVRVNQLTHLECRLFELEFNNRSLYNDIIKIRDLID